MKRKHTERNEFSGMRLIFLSLCLFTLFLVEFFFMINEREQIFIITLIGILLVLDLYFILKDLVTASNEKKNHDTVQYENIVKAEKATFMLLRKNFNEINEKMNHLNENSDIPVGEIIETEKAIYKIMLRRQKEHADAILNANDSFNEQLNDFEKKLKEIDYNFGERQKSISMDVVREVTSMNQEMNSVLREMELTISNNILRYMNTLSSQIQGRKPGPEMIGEEIITTTLAEQFSEESGQEDTLMDEVLALEDEIKQSGEIHDKPQMPDMTEPNKMMTPDEIAALIANME
ncbi:MAG: hypothetical protein ACK5ML_07045 [Lachnospiraceae bacterium]